MPLLPFASARLYALWSTSTGCAGGAMPSWSASCTCTLISGAVRDMRSGEIASEPGQPIRLCVNAPHTDVEIDL